MIKRSTTPNQLPPLGGESGKGFPFQRGKGRGLGFALFFLFLLLSSCARMGQPDGGWYDETPPHIVSTSPADQSTNVKTRKVIINFDEYIKIENASEKVVVSPPQIEQAEIKSQGKRIVVALKDTLQDNTTYTIDFSDAITDNNEGNPLGNYTYTFSTGDHIDTLQVAGYIIEAENLEPVKGILVGLYKVEAPTDSLSSISADSIFMKQPLQRVSRTDENGHFVIKGVAEGQYRVFALQDADANYMFSQKSEMIGFNDIIYTPSWKDDVRQDTLWRDSLHIKDIIQTPYTHFLPDDIVLSAFIEKQTERYFVKSDRSEADHFTLFFSYGHPELPQIKGLDFDATDAFVVEPTVTQDTITYWLRDTALVNRDTLTIAMTYMATDSLGGLHEQCDTLELLPKIPYERRLKMQNEELEKWQKKQERNKKRGRTVETTLPGQELKVDYRVSSSIDPDQNLYFTMPTPLEKADTAAVHLYEKQDSLWYRSRFLFGERAGYPRTYQLIGEWKPGTEYSLEIDSAAFVDIYGHASKAYKQGFKVMATTEYSTIIVTLDGITNKQKSQAFVQLLNQSDKVVKEVPTENGVATIYYIKPGTYYLRTVIDENGNGIWDTGEYALSQQAEAVYYYPSKIECRAKWDVPINWNVTAKPLSQQKPQEIVKQKGDKQRKQLAHRNAERARKLGIEYVP